MKKLFKEKFTNYEETDLSNAKDMDFRVSDMIIRELLPDVDYNEWSAILNKYIHLNYTVKD